MENATKALLIAGGVLISIILISLLVRTYGNISNIKNQEITEKELQQIESENKEYTKYIGKTVYGTEVITVINRAVSTTPRPQVSIAFLEEGYDYTIKKGKKEKSYHVNQMQLSDIEEALNAGLDSQSSAFGSTTESNGQTILSGLKGKAFKCDKVEYDNYTGKVNYISFQEIKISVNSIPTP